jgi:hypothetical protein
MFTKNELLDIMCGLSDSNARWMETLENENSTYNAESVYRIMDKNHKLWEKVAKLHDEARDKVA